MIVRCGLKILSWGQLFGIMRLDKWCRTVIPSDEIFNMPWTTIFLHTLPSTIAFRLEYVLFDQFYTEITVFFDQEMFGSVLFKTLRLKMFEGKLMSTWHQKSSSWRHAHASSYTPPCKTTFPCPGQVHGNSGWVCKNGNSNEHPQHMCLWKTVENLSFNYHQRPIVSVSLHTIQHVYWH